MQLQLQLQLILKFNRNFNPYRIRRINSSLIDYYYFSSKIALQLTSRGYEHKDLLKLIDSIAKIDRSLLLKYKEKIDYQKNITLVCKLYDINLLDLNFNLLKNIYNLSQRRTYHRTKGSVSPQIFEKKYSKKSYSLA